MAFVVAPSPTQGDSGFISSLSFFIALFICSMMLSDGSWRPWVSFEPETTLQRAMINIERVSEILGGTRALEHRVRTLNDLHDIVAEGLPKTSENSIVDRGDRARKRRETPPPLSRVSAIQIRRASIKEGVRIWPS